MKAALPFLAILLAYSGIPARADESPTRPNLVFLLADDLGWTWIR